MSNWVLSVLAGFIIQTKEIIFRDKPKLSRNGQSNQGVAIQPGFSSKVICSFENMPICCVYKTGTKYASKDEIELAVFKAFREVLIEILSFGFGVAVLVPALLLAVLLIDGFSLVHTVIYYAHKQAHNQEEEIKILSLSSNREQLRYRDRSNIFGSFLMARLKLC